MTEAEYIAAELTIDADGIRLGDVHVMPSAERDVIQAEVRRLCDMYRPRRVLELGFGLGYSADAFQGYGVDVHTIVEVHPTIVARARTWATGRPGVTIIPGLAQTIPIPNGAWDLVFDDRCEVTDIPMDTRRFVHGHWFTCSGYGLET